MGEHKEGNKSRKGGKIAIAVCIIVIIALLGSSMLPTIWQERRTA